MLKPRIIPSLLIHKNGLIKTNNFNIENSRYVGDPLNAVRIFNEKKADEIIISDIEATINNNEPNYDLISKIASECRMPLCYVGGIRNLKQIEMIISLGVEKVGIGSACISNPDLISEAAKRVGSQSVVVIMDVKKYGLFNKYKVFTHNGKKQSKFTPSEFLDKFQSLGAGEIIINSIDHDGTMKGYDLKLIDSLYCHATTPITIIGGAGSLKDMESIFKRYGTIGAAAGSLFVFKGKYKAVLIQYPSTDEKNQIYPYNLEN